MSIIMDDLNTLILIEISKGPTSLRELARATRKSVSTIQSRLIILQRAKLVDWKKGQHRSLFITPEGKKYVPVNPRMAARAN